MFGKILLESRGMMNMEIPEWLNDLKDTFLRGLSDEDGIKFVSDLTKAMPHTVHLQIIGWKFCAFLLRENIERIQTLPNVDESLREEALNILHQALHIHEKDIKNGKWDRFSAFSAHLVGNDAWYLYTQLRAKVSDIDWNPEWDKDDINGILWTIKFSLRAASWVVNTNENDELMISTATFDTAKAVGSMNNSLDATYRRYANELLRLLKEEGS
jgi:hypothetical protein